jgi:tRNA (Thr-GGU) A37 N-methylase
MNADFNLNPIGLDVVDGTPLIDIKPYIPQRDVVMNAKVPRWVEKLHEREGEDRG